MSFFLTTILKQLKNNHFFIPPFHKLHINKGFSVFLLTFRDYTICFCSFNLLFYTNLSLFCPLYRNLLTSIIKSSGLSLITT